jgi:30S ribosomal protein S31
MGRGDRKSRRGKINQGSFGKTRPRKIKKIVIKKTAEQKADTK